MIDVTFNRIRVGAPAKIRFGNEDFQRAGEVVAGDVRRNILKQKQADGSPLKRNAPGTLSRKRKKGLPLLSLIAEGRRLVKQGAFRVTLRKGMAIVRPVHADISRWVQKMGYTGWLGPSREGRKAVIQVFREAIERARKEASKKVQRG